MFFTLCRILQNDLLTITHEQIKIVVKVLYVISSENKVTKLLIQEFFLFKYGFMRDADLNERSLY